MFKVSRIDARRLDIEMSGKLDADEMKRALDELEAAARGVEQGIMLFDVVDYHLPSLAAIGVELARLPALIRLVTRFDRAAVLADKAWLRHVSELEGALYPGLEIKAFDRDRRSEAERWLAGPGA